MSLKVGDIATFSSSSPELPDIEAHIVGHRVKIIESHAEVQSQAKEILLMDPISPKKNLTRSKCLLKNGQIQPAFEILQKPDHIKKYLAKELRNKKKVDIIRKLRSFYHCLMESMTNQELSLVVDQNGFFQLQHKELKDTLKQSDMHIHMHIYMNLLSALNLRIYRIPDNHQIDLRMIRDLAKIKFDISTPLQKQVTEEFEPLEFEPFLAECDIKEELKSLLLPRIDEIENLSAKEKTTLRILQRLYPQLTPFEADEKVATSLQIPIFPPNVFLASFKQFTTTSALLNLIKKTLTWHEIHMPLSQKVRLLNFLRSLVDSLLYKEEWTHHKAAIDEILSLGKKLNSREAYHTCLEIHEILCAAPISLKKRGVTSLKDFFEKLLAQELTESDFAIHVDLIADDMKILASETIAQLSFSQLVSDKIIEGKTPSYEKYGKGLFQLILSRIEMALDSLAGKDKQSENATIRKSSPPTLTKKEILKDSATRIKIESIIRFTIHLMGASVKRHDFLSSFYLFFLLNSSDVDPYFQTKKPQKKLKMFKEANNAPIALDLSTFEIYKTNETLFLSHNNTLLKEAMKTCKDKKIEFIPAIPAIKPSLIYKTEASSSRKESLSRSEKNSKVDGEKIDIELLRKEAIVLLNTEATLKTAIDFYNKSPSLKTNIKSFIEIGFGS